MAKIALFYHSLLFNGTPPQLLDAAAVITSEQMWRLDEVGLTAAASEFVVGMNGGDETLKIARLLVSSKAKFVMHGLDAHTENCTLFEIEKWVQDHPDWLVLYFHCKGATHPLDDPLRTNWRKCMMRNLIDNWKQCVSDLESGYDAVGCHWMTGEKTPPGQSIFAGNFWWAQSNYLRTIPSMLTRPRIIDDGLKAASSRYESEVWIGNGSRFPKVKDYHPEWIDQCKP